MEARGWLRAKKEAENEATRQKDALTSLAKEYADVLGGFEYAEQERRKTEAERDKLPEVNPEEET